MRIHARQAARFGRTLMASLMATILISNQVFLGASEGAAVRRGYTLAIYSAGLSGLDGDSFSEYEGF